MSSTLQEFLVNVRYNVDATSQTNAISMLKKFSTSIGGVAGEIAALAAAVLAMTHVFAETGEKFYWMSQRIGSSVTDIKSAQYAMAGLGQSSEQALGNIEKFGSWTRTMGPAASGYLRSLGVTATDTAGRLTQLASYFRNNAASPDSLEYAINLRRAQMMGLDEQTMIGMQSGKWQQKQNEIGFIQRMIWGAKTQEELTQRQQEWATKSNAVMDQFRKMGTIFDTMKERFASSLFDKILPQLERFNDWLLTNKDLIQVWLEAAATWLGKFIAVINGVVQTVGYAIKAFTELPVALQHMLELLVSMPAIIGLLKSPLAWFILTLGALMMLLEDYMVWKEGGDSAINWSGVEGLASSIGDMLKPLDEVRLKFDAWFKDITGLNGIFTDILVTLGAIALYFGPSFIIGGLGRAAVGLAANAASLMAGTLSGMTLGGAALGAGVLAGAVGVGMGAVASDEQDAADLGYTQIGSSLTGRTWRGPDGKIISDAEMSRILLQKKSGQIIPGGATTPFTEQPRQEASNAPSNQFAGPGVPTGNYGAATSGSASGAFLANYVTREDDNLNFSRGGGGGTGGTGGTSMGAPSTAGMSESKAEFIAKAWPLAVKAGQETGIDPRIILAQAGIESGWGKHAPNNNYFGIKGQGGTFMTDEVINGKRVRMAQSFAGYGSMEASFQGYADFINRNQRYGRLKQGGSLATQASNLQATGYATDPDYGGKVLGVASGLQVPALGSETAGATASMSGGAGGGRSFSIENNTVINVAAGPDAQATASAVAFNQTRVNEQHVRLSEGKIR